MDEYSKKLDSFIFKNIENKKNIKILEFGVRQGISTIKFLQTIKQTMDIYTQSMSMIAEKYLMIQIGHLFKVEMMTLNI